MPKIIPKCFGKCTLDIKSIIRVNTRVKIINGVESLSHNSIGMIALENIPMKGTMITRFKILEPIIFPITI